MQQAARLQLNSARIRASQTFTRVTPANASLTVRVTALDVIARAGRSAFVVTLGNGGRRAVSDLPISVGYIERSGRKGANSTYLNAGDNLSYFDAHTPAIAPRGSVTWVFTASRALPVGARAFALVGSATSLRANPTKRLPKIAVVTARPSTVPGRLVVALDNLSAVPQYQLQVYALARRAGTVVAAGEATVDQLNTSSTKTIDVPVLGSVSRATVQVEAVPTTFQ